MIDKLKRNAANIDDLVEYVTLHTVSPVALSGVVWPFALSYLVCLFFIYQSGDENYELGLIVLAAVACIHILTSLCCYWSVHISAFLNCRKVSCHLLSYFIQIVQTNNGLSCDWTSSNRLR